MLTLKDVTVVYECRDAKSTLHMAGLYMALRPCEADHMMALHYYAWALTQLGKPRDALTCLALAEVEASARQHATSTATAALGQLRAEFKL